MVSENVNEWVIDHAKDVSEKRRDEYLGGVLLWLGLSAQFIAATMKFLGAEKIFEAHPLHSSQLGA